MRYHDAFNTIGLVSSPAVLAAVRTFQAEIFPANAARARTTHDEKYSKLFNALRQRLTGPRRRKVEDLNLGMITTRPSSNSSTPLSK